LSFISSAINQIDFFILILLRISGFIFTSPVFGRREIPNILKIGFCLYLSYMLLLSGLIPQMEMAAGLGPYLLTGVLEVSKGMLLGWVSMLFFSLFMTAGQLIDIQVGFQMAGILDPQFGTKTPLTGNLLNILVFVVFFQVNAHLDMLTILIGFFRATPIGSLINIQQIYALVSNAFIFTFFLGVKIALPIILIILFVEVVLGVIVKFMPQMNVFVIGIPFKILVGLVSLRYLIGPLGHYLDFIFQSMHDYMSGLYL
jgi:flagellar biosynthetic protein FliR